MSSTRTQRRQPRRRKPTGEQPTPSSTGTDGVAAGAEQPTEGPVVGGEAEEGATPPAGEPGRDGGDAAAPVDPPEPGEDKGTPSEVEVFAKGFGALTITSTQTSFTELQAAAFKAINIDVDEDPQVIPHIRAFMHTCQTRGLDPWLGEAYLIGRGQIGTQWRKFTIQTGINGYLKMAEATGRFIRVADVLFSGPEDDDTSYYRDDRGVRRREWTDTWPKAKGRPALARAIIEHYDSQGNKTETYGDADWAMFAPEYPKYTGKGPSRQKVVDAQGNDVMELGEFWERGPAHMLGKCAIAVALRLAFPGSMAGTYITEEMHRADAIERARADAAEKELRIKARAERVAAAAEPKPADGDVTGADDVLSAPDGGPMPAEVLEGEVVDEDQGPAGDDTQRRQWLLDELHLIAEVTGQSANALTRRWTLAHRLNYDDPKVTVTDLQQLVGGMLRNVGAAAMVAKGNAEHGRHWGAIPSDQSGPEVFLLGGERERTVVDEANASMADTPTTA